MRSRVIRFSALSSMSIALAASAAAQGPANQPPPPTTVSSSAGNIRIERVATLEFPWGMAVLPDGRVLITEKPGRLRIWASGQLSAPVQGVPSVLYRGDSDQGGLLDVEADPNFATNRLIYISTSKRIRQALRFQRPVSSASAPTPT